MEESKILASSQRFNVDLVQDNHYLFIACKSCGSSVTFYSERWCCRECDEWFGSHVQGQLPCTWYIPELDCDTESLRHWVSNWLGVSEYLLDVQIDWPVIVLA